MWEYKVINVPAVAFKFENVIVSTQDVCDRMGDEGWELVNFQCFDVSSKLVMIFKRKKA